MEKAIICQVAGKLISAIPEEKRNEILTASLEKTLHEMFRPWNIEKAIKEDAEKYMAEYVARPEIQEKVKLATHKAVDELMDGVIRAVVLASQDRIKSTYSELSRPKKSEESRFCIH